MKRKDFSHIKIQIQKEQRSFFEHEHFIAGVLPFTRGNNTSSYFQEIKVQNADFFTSKFIIPLNTHQNTEDSITEAVLQGYKYLKSQFLKGVTANVALPKIIFEQQAEGKMHFEIAKIKAARTLWSKIMVILFKTDTPKIKAMPIFYQMKEDIVLEAMTAVFCEIQHIILPKKSVFTKEEMNYFLKEELSITKVTDPWGGSFIIEKEVDRLIKNCWDKIKGTLSTL